VYFSMGGSRAGGFRTFVNAMTTMLLVGLWHGASWIYVFWGGLHGVLLAAERILQAKAGARRIWQSIPGRAFLWLLTMGVLCATMMVFRAQSFGDMGRLALSMVGLGAGLSSHVLKGTEVTLIGGVMVIMLGIHWLMRDTTVEAVATRLPWWIRSIALAGMLGAIATMSGDTNAFIYFQF
jgi:D-alanyl-lipoteichoic acid acyltransferase DltB (MBOAT superfamily)